MRRLAVAAAFLLIVAACSGSDSSDSTTTVGATTSVKSGGPADGGASARGTGLIEPGAEPRVELRITEDADTTILVETTRQDSYAVGGSAGQSEDMGAVYQLVVESTVSGSSSRVTLTPTVSSLVAGEAVPTSNELGTWLWRLDENGLPLSIDNDGLEGRVGRDAATLFNVPHLILVAPEDPVGPGAQWAYVIGTGGDQRGAFTLEEITESDITVTFQVTLEVEGGSLTIRGEATYDRGTLLVRSGELESDLDYSATVSVDGEPAELTGTRHVTLAYSEVDE